MDTLPAPLTLPKDGTMSRFMTIEPPVYNDYIPSLSFEPVTWAKWYLYNKLEYYLLFRSYALEWMRTRPNVPPISGRTILHAIRYSALTTNSDAAYAYRVNNNASSLFGRLFREEFPDANIELRDCVWDNLRVYEWRWVTDYLRLLTEEYSNNVC